MRFLLGVLVGFILRGKKKLLITVLAAVAFIVFIILFGNHPFGAPFGRCTGAPVEASSNQSCGAQGIEL